MNITFDVEAIRKMDLSSVVPKLFVRDERDHRERDRVYEKHESQYRMLQWLSWQVNGVQILDVGTRAGTSAFCLADNPANFVTACDISHLHKKIDIRPFLARANIGFIEGPANEIPKEILLRSPILSLDISHNGDDEVQFLALLEEIGYNGIVIMDDINFPRRFEKLHDCWINIKRPKLMLPRPIAHDTGTGLVVYGQHSISVVSTPA